MESIMLLLGTNVGTRNSNLKLACEKLEYSKIEIINRSSIYETEPWGYEPQRSFFNQVLIVETQFDPNQLLNEIQRIEAEMGRIKKQKYGPRIIDIDILLFENQIVNDENLIIPHPQMHNRRFTLIPANEIGTGIVHPVLGQTISQLLDNCNDSGEVVLVEKPN